MPYKLVFALCAAVLGLFLVFSNIALRRERNELKTALRTTLDRVEELQDEMRRQAEVLAERETKIGKLAADKSRLSKKLKEAAEHEQEVKLWIDAVVPPSVSGMLKDGKPEADCSRAFDEMLRNSSVERQY